MAFFSKEELRLMEEEYQAELRRQRACKSSPFPLNQREPPPADRPRGMGVEPTPGRDLVSELKRETKRFLQKGVRDGQAQKYKKLKNT